MRFLVLRSYDNYITAQLRLQQLEAEGIRAVLQDEYTVTIDPILTNAVGGIKLLVPEAQWGRAGEIMNQLEELYRRSASCPSCGAHTVERVPQPNNPANWLSALMTWILGSYAVPVNNIYRCFSCGKEMEKLPESFAEPLN